MANELTTDERDEFRDRISTLETERTVLGYALVGIVGFFGITWATHASDWWEVKEDYSTPTIVHGYSFWLTNSKVTYEWHYNGKDSGAWYELDKTGKPSGQLHFADGEAPPSPEP